MIVLRKPREKQLEDQFDSIYGITSLSQEIREDIDDLIWYKEYLDNVLFKVVVCKKQKYVSTSSSIYDRTSHLADILSGS